MHVSAVDLFCGAGGLTHGLERAGISVEAGIDADPDCRHAYVANNDAAFLEADVEELVDQGADLVAGLFDEGADATVLAGCAPCQPFSSLTNGSGGKGHEKWGLLSAFEEVVGDVQPDVVAMENVSQIKNHGVYDNFVKALDNLGYVVNPPDDREVYCPEYGIPQNRRRLVLLASRKGPIRLEEPTCPTEEDYPDVGAEIEDLDPISAGETHEEDLLHRAQGLSTKNLKRIRHSEPGGSWEDWPEELLLACHKKDSGSSYTPVYGRVDPEGPGPTITTQFFNYGSGRFGHPEQDRPLSIREGAIIQTFPEDYEFFESWDGVSLQKAGRLIGNAVPPKLGEVVGRSILAHLADEQGAASIEDFAGLASAP